jgi:glucose uptake protein GlcU
MYKEVYRGNIVISQTRPVKHEVMHCNKNKIVKDQTTYILTIAGLSWSIQGTHYKICSSSYGKKNAFKISKDPHVKCIGICNFSMKYFK